MPEALPTVSVIIPTFNREHLLPVSVDSVRAQTYSDWELLLVDDHSTDSSQELIEGWSKEDCRIRYLVNERSKGPAGARNTGIDHARGRYIAFLDSDDEWLPYHLQRMVQVLDVDDGKIDLMTANAVRKLRSSGEVYGTATANLDRGVSGKQGAVWLFRAEDTFDRILRGECLITTQTIVVRRECLNHIRFRDVLPPGPEDYFFQLELTNAGLRVGHLADVHVVYWAHGENLTTAGGIHDPEKIVSLFQTYQVQYKLALRTLKMSRRQRSRVIKLLCDEAFWQIGYNGFMQLGNGREARRWFRTAIRRKPWRLDYWKTYLVSLVLHPSSTTKKI